MTKTVILGIAVAAVLVTGLIAFMPEAISDPKVSEERDNVNVLHMTLEYPQIMVIVDNAGIGGTSDVEMVWRFDSTKCMLLVATAPAPGLGLVVVAPDGALGADPAHADAFGVDAVVLAAKTGKICIIDPDMGEFVTVSTVGSTKK